jgi:hypothetical protein
MSTTTNRVRWNCPNERHPGVLGPGRPPKDSLVRYCLDCSVETGRLVARVAPALERKRAAAAVTSKAKAKAKRSRAALAREKAKAAETERYTVEGVDLRDEFKRLIRLRAFGGLKGRLYRRPPQFRINRRSQYPTRRHGYAEPWLNRITMCNWPSLTLARARETLVHELTHIVVGHSHTEGWHGPTFRRTLKAAFIEAYKVNPKMILDDEGWYEEGLASALRRKERGEG